MIDSIATIGDAGDINCWSGTPYFFGKAARARGEPAVPWRVDYGSTRAARFFWNLGRSIRGRGIGGYQYSRSFLHRAEGAIPAAEWRGRIVTFNQHFPRGSSAAARGCSLVNYIDATFNSFCVSGGLAARLPEGVREEARLLELENFSMAERVVTMSRWAADSAIRNCGVPASKVTTILPGANLDLPPNHEFPPPGRSAAFGRPLILGFVGKDWKRKGLPFLLDVRAALERMGMRALIRCAGRCPADLKGQSGVEYAGFIDKAREPDRFVRFLAGCDIGCLFSDREPLGISTLEFLRVGIPVAGVVAEGIADTVPPDAGLRFEPGTSAEVVASALGAVFRDEAKVSALCTAAQAWSPLVTWDRCVAEWQELLSTGALKSPVQPWRGLSGNLDRDPPAEEEHEKRFNRTGRTFTDAGLSNRRGEDNP